MTQKDVFYSHVGKTWTADQISRAKERIYARLIEEKELSLWPGEESFYGRLNRLYIESRGEYNTFIMNIGEPTDVVRNLELKVLQDKHSEEFKEDYEWIRNALAKAITEDDSRLIWEEILSESVERFKKSSNESITKERYKEKIIGEISCSICEEIIENKYVTEQLGLQEFFLAATTFLSAYKEKKFEIEKIIIKPASRYRKKVDNLYIENEGMINDIINYGLQSAIERHEPLANRSTDIDQLRERKKKFPHRVVRRIIMVLIQNKVIDQFTNTKSTFISPSGECMKISNELGALVHDLLLNLKIIGNKPGQNDINLDVKQVKANRVRSYGGYGEKSSIFINDDFSYDDICDDFLSCWIKYNKKKGYL